MRLFSKCKKWFLTHWYTNTNSICRERDVWRCWWKNFYISGQRSESKMSWSSLQGVVFMGNISHSNSLVFYCETLKPRQWFSKETIHFLKVRGGGAHAIGWSAELACRAQNKAKLQAPKFKVRKITTRYYDSTWIFRKHFHFINLVRASQR